MFYFLPLAAAAAAGAAPPVLLTLAGDLPLPATAGASQSGTLVQDLDLLLVGALGMVAFLVWYWKMKKIRVNRVEGEQFL